MLRSDVRLTPSASQRHGYHAGLGTVDLFLSVHVWGFVERACRLGLHACIPWSVDHAILVALCGFHGAFGKTKNHAAPGTIFPLTSLGFVLNSCYPLVIGIFFANSLGVWELLPAGGSGCLFP